MNRKQSRVYLVKSMLNFVSGLITAMTAVIYYQRQQWPPVLALSLASLSFFIASYLYLKKRQEQDVP